MRGLRTKILDFYNSTLTSKHNLIFITETWLYDGILDSELTDTNKYNVFRRDRGSRGGGVMALCAAELGVRSRDDWQRDDLDIECVWLTVDGGLIGDNRDLHICLIYLPPDRLQAQRLGKFTDMLNIIISSHSSDHFMLVGDFNLSFIKWRFNEPQFIKKGNVDLYNTGVEFLTQTSFHGLNQYNCSINSAGNTLDLVFSNFSLDISCHDDPLVKEDKYHNTLDIIPLDLNITHLPKISQFKYIFKKADYSLINVELNKIDWEEILNLGTVDDAVDKFYEILKNIIKQNVPLVEITHTNSFPVWYSRALVSIIKEKKKIHSFWKKYSNPVDYEAFSILRARQKSLQRQCLNRHIKISQEKIKQQPDLLWKYVNSKKKCSSSYPNTMFINNQKFSNGKDISQAFNNYFKDIFITSTDTYNASVYTNNQFTNIISSLNITEDQIKTLILKLDGAKSAGSDAIPPIFILNCAASLPRPLEIIFNRSIKEGIFPKHWKDAHIVPIHKKSSKAIISNYRPISILNIFSKIFERIVYNNIFSVIMQGIPPEQHGFVKGRSTLSNLTIFTSDILSGMSTSGQVDAIYTDFEKAFDRVDHIILLKKLQELGIHGDLMRWFCSYVSNRRQAVVVGGYKSDFVTVTSGIPQGSLLGPLLYISYIFDIKKCFKYSKFLMYADDKKIYCNINSISDCVNMQKDLDRLSLYYIDNRIKVNIAKCVQITFSRKNIPIIFSYKLNNEIITKTNTVKDLGVILDKKLTFSEHIESITDKAYRNLGFVIRTCKPFTDVNCIKILYYAYVRSILEYLSPIWNPQYIVYDEAIERIQNKFIKYLNYKSQSPHAEYKLSCINHGITTLKNRRVINDMVFLHDICSGNLDCSELVSNILRLCVPTTRTRHTRLFSVPYSRTKYASNSINQRILHTYNELFSKIDPFCMTKNKFKKSISLLQE